MYMSCRENETLRCKSEDEILCWNALVGGVFACSPMMPYRFTELSTCSMTKPLGCSMLESFRDIL